MTYGHKTNLIRSMLSREPVSTRDIAAALAISPSRAAAFLSQMVRRNEARMLTRPTMGRRGVPATWIAP